jgi:hypothetical protein
MERRTTVVNVSIDGVPLGHRWIDAGAVRRRGGQPGRQSVRAADVGEIGPAMSLGVTQESHADCADLSEWEGEEAFVAVQGAARRPLSLVESAVFDVVDLHDRVGSGEVEGETLSGDE